MTGEEGRKGGREGETEFTSTEPPRHSAPDCDIYPPSPQPTLCFCHPRVSILPSRLPSYTPGGPTPHIDPLPSASFTTAIPLRGLSAAFPSTKFQPLFSPLFATIALLPPFRNALSDSALVWGFANARIRLVSDSRHYFFHEEVCISYTTARGVLLYVVFSQGLEGRHSSGARIRNPPTIRGA